jgi:hypothetical protein
MLKYLFGYRVSYLLPKTLKFFVRFEVCTVVKIHISYLDYALQSVITQKTTVLLQSLILRVVIFGCETLSLTLRKKCKLNVCGRRVLGRCGFKWNLFDRPYLLIASWTGFTWTSLAPKPKIGGWKELHDDELYNLYCSSSDRAIKSKKDMRGRWVFGTFVRKMQLIHDSVLHWEKQYTRMYWRTCSQNFTFWKPSLRIGPPLWSSGQSS